MKSGDFAGEIVTTTLVVMITMTAYKLLRDAHMCRKPSFSLCSSKAKGEGRDHSSMYVQYIQPHIRCSPFSVSLHINKYTSILCVCVCVCVCVSSDNHGRDHDQIQNVTDTIQIDVEDCKSAITGLESCKDDVPSRNQVLRSTHTSIRIVIYIYMCVCVYF